MNLERPETRESSIWKKKKRRRSVYAPRSKQSCCWLPGPRNLCLYRSVSVVNRTGRKPEEPWGSCDKESGTRQDTKRRRAEWRRPWANIGLLGRNKQISLSLGSLHLFHPQWNTFFGSSRSQYHPMAQMTLACQGAYAYFLVCFYNTTVHHNHFSRSGHKSRYRRSLWSCRADHGPPVHLNNKESLAFSSGPRYPHWSHGGMTV